MVDAAMLRVVFVAVVAALALASGCGGGEGDESATPTQDETTTTEATTQSETAESETTAIGGPTPEETIRLVARYVSREQYGPYWELLHPAQQRLISRAAFLDCWARSTGEVGAITIVDVYHDSVLLPGIGETPATSVTWREDLPSGEETFTRQVVRVDGRWRYVLPSSLTSEIEEGTCPIDGRPLKGRETASGYLSGYPKSVPISKVPGRMFLDSGAEEGATTAIAVAPGVWVRDAPGTSPLEDAENGSIFGWCAAVRKFEAAHPNRASGSTCW